MTEHEDRQTHEAKADALERELDDMRERSGRLGDDIEGAGEDWERRKKDSQVPGAAGEPEQADGPEPEAQYPDKQGDDDDDGVDSDEVDFGRDVDSDAVVAEDGPPSEEKDD